MPNLRKYMENDNDEELIRSTYKHAITLRLMGLLVNNNDAVNVAKMEIMHVEIENRKLESENEHLAKELDAYKQFVALQGKTLQTPIK